MPSSFFQELICHGVHDDSFDSGSDEDGECSPLSRQDARIVAQKHILAESIRPPKNDTSVEGNVPAWHDMDRYGGRSRKPVNDLELNPTAVSQIPKDRRLSFPDERQEAIKTHRASTDPEADRCKAMCMATKQAALREEAAKEYLDGPVNPILGLPSPQRTLTRLPPPPKNHIGFGSFGSSKALPVQPLPSFKCLNTSDPPTPYKTKQPRSPLHQSVSALPAKPQGPPPQNTSTANTPRSQKSFCPTSPLGSQQHQRSNSFLLKTGPPRCPSQSQIPSQTQSTSTTQSVGNFQIARSNSNQSIPTAPIGTGKWNSRGKPSGSASPGPPPPSSPRPLQQSSNRHHSVGPTKQHPKQSTPRLSVQTASFVPPPPSPGPVVRSSSLIRNKQSNSYAPPCANQKVQTLSFVPPPEPKPTTQSGSFVPPPDPIRNAQTNSYVPPQNNSYVPPPNVNSMRQKSCSRIAEVFNAMVHSNSYAPDSSPMPAVGSRPCLTPDDRYPHSLEPSPQPEVKVPSRQCSVAAPPPRMLSFEGPVAPPLPWMLPNPIGRDSVSNFLNSFAPQQQGSLQACRSYQRVPSQRSLSNEPHASK